MKLNCRSLYVYLKFYLICLRAQNFSRGILPNIRDLYCYWSYSLLIIMQKSVSVEAMVLSYKYYLFSTLYAKHLSIYEGTYTEFFYVN